MQSNVPFHPLMCEYSGVLRGTLVSVGETCRKQNKVKFKKISTDLILLFIWDTYKEFVVLSAHHEYVGTVNYLNLPFFSLMQSLATTTNKNWQKPIQWRTLKQKAKCNTECKAHDASISRWNRTPESSSIRRNTPAIQGLNSTNGLYLQPRRMKQQSLEYSDYMGEYQDCVCGSAITNYI